MVRLFFQRETSSLGTFLILGKNVLLWILNCQQQQKEKVKQSIRDVEHRGIKPEWNW